MRRLKHHIAKMLLNLGGLWLLRFIRVKGFRFTRMCVLCYHRVCEQDLLLSPSRVTPKEFVKHVKLLKSCNRILDLDDYYLEKESHEDQVAFTFDDGYLNNLQYAIPTLNENNISAIFYVASKPILEDKVYWIDLLGSHLEYVIKSQDRSHPIYLLREHKFWKKQFRANHEEKRRVALELLAELSSNVSALKEFLKKLPDISDLFHPDRKLMSLGDLKRIQDMGHHVGGHTVNHFRLSTLDEDELEYEMCESVESLKQAGLNVTHFAYPFGKKADVGDRALNMAEKQGFKFSVTTEDGVVTSTDKPQALPRFVVSYQSAEQLLLKMEMLSWKKMISEKLSMKKVEAI